MVVALVAGLVCLIIGAEALVRGASRLAARAGIPPLIIGLTVVAFGTSSPELAVSLKAALDDQAAIALGNVVGSNIFNVLFILGLSALVVPLVVARQLIRLDIPVMIGLSLLVWLLAANGQLGRLEGLLLVAGLVGYLGVLLRQARREAVPESDASRAASGHWAWQVALVVGGLALLVLGSRWLVGGAVSLAQALGVGEQVIGLTLIAAGTSLPEVVTSLVAALRGERDIAVGNVVGSNVFNLLGVLGLTVALAPTGIQVPPAMIAFDLPVMLAVALACLPLGFTGGTIVRWEGAVLFGYYLAYTLYLILASAHHAALPAFATVMLYFVVPITVLTLVVVATQEARRR
ncbi:calcium/sodium antiporter [Halomonas salifodinae]|uniref:Calcium/sodium antiporter n=1 Tax=Halomonas salifodinae TaxID=438745 RepID=A0ABW2EQ25_9GAMM